MTASEPSLPGAPLVSNDCQESGLWLWHGETPPQGAASPPASPDRSSSPVERIADLVGSTARRARWMGPPMGWFLIGFAAFVMAHALSGKGQLLRIRSLLRPNPRHQRPPLCLNLRHQRPPLRPNRNHRRAQRCRPAPRRRPACRSRSWVKYRSRRGQLPKRWPDETNTYQPNGGHRGGRGSP
jgi:hypothetical protein